MGTSLQCALVPGVCPDTSLPLGSQHSAGDSEAEFTVTCVVLHRAQWQLVTSNSIGLGSHARVPDEKTESEGSEELPGDVRNDGHSRQMKEHVSRCKRSDARKDAAALEAEPSGWGIRGLEVKEAVGQTRETQGPKEVGPCRLSQNLCVESKIKLF